MLGKLAVASKGLLEAVLMSERRKVASVMRQAERNSGCSI